MSEIDLNIIDSADSCGECDGEILIQDKKTLQVRMWWVAEDGYYNGSGESFLSIEMLEALIAEAKSKGDKK